LPALEVRIIPFLSIKGKPSIEYYCNNCGVEMDKFEFYDQTNNPVEDLIGFSKAFQLESKNPVLIRRHGTGEVVR